MYTPQINLKTEQEGQLAHTVHKSHLTINTPAVSTYTSQVIPQNHHTHIHTKSTTKHVIHGYNFCLKHCFPQVNTSVFLQMDSHLHL